MNLIKKFLRNKKAVQTILKRNEERVRNIDSFMKQHLDKSHYEKFCRFLKIHLRTTISES